MLIINRLVNNVPCENVKPRLISFLGVKTVNEYYVCHYFLHTVPERKREQQRLQKKRDAEIAEERKAKKQKKTADENMFNQAEAKVLDFLDRAGTRVGNKKKIWTPCDEAKNIKKGDLIVVRKGYSDVADMPYSTICAVLVDEVNLESYNSGSYTRIEGAAFKVQVDHIEPSNGSSWNLYISLFFYILEVYNNQSGSPKHDFKFSFISSNF